MKDNLPKLTPKQDKFVKAYTINGGNATQAAIEAGYKVDNARVMGAENLSKPAIQAHLEEHKKQNNKAYTISVEKRLKWLEEITEAGLGEYHDQQGNSRKENLSAAKGAIEVMNNMLGTDTESDSAKPLSITFNVAEAKAEVRVTNGK